MKEFIGAGHTDVLNLLLDRFDALVDNPNVRVPRVVLLRGASGVGKSRIVRELYRTLRVRRGDAYWPEIEESGGGDGRSRDPLPGRKAIGPEISSFVWPGGALPTFGWWQFHCERMQKGDVIDVTAQARLDLEAHLVPLAMAWSDVASLRQKAGRQKTAAVEAAKDALQEGGLEVAARVLDQFGIAIPGLGLGLSWLAKGVKAVSEARDRENLRTEGASLGEQAEEARRSAADELADLITGVTHIEIPGVVVIEDLHLMDDGMRALLDALTKIRSRHPILVVGTAWPESDDAGVYGRWRADATASGALQVVTVPQLGSEELVGIIRSFAPNTTVDVAMAAAAKLPNPLALEATLSTGRVERAVRANDGALPEEALDAVPASVEEVYRSRFRELDDVVQTGLALCAGSLPDTDAARVWPFIRRIVVEAVTGNEATQEFVGEALHSIEPAIQDGIWLIADGVANSFREALQASVAVEHLRNELLLPSDYRSYRAAIEGALRKWINTQRGEGYWLSADDESLILCRWYREICSDAEDLAFVVASIHVAVRLAETYQFRSAIALVEPLMDALALDHPDMLWTRGKLASWLGDSGRIGEAIGQFEELLADQVRWLGADHRDTMTTRSNLASLLGESGRVGEAIVQFEVLLAEQVRWLGADHRDTFATRHNLAGWLGESGRIGEAIDQCEALLEELTDVLGRDDPDTLTTRHNLAFWLGESGRIGEAIDQCEELVADQTRVFGAGNAFTFRTRNNLAFWLGESGRVAEAIGQFEVLVADRVRVLGADHPDTLRTRSSLAFWIGRSGRVSESIGQCEAALADQIRVVGADNPHTLKTRNYLASLLGESGRMDEAIGQFEALVADQTRVLKADHPDTLRTRSDRAFWLGESGRVGEAIGQLEVLVAEQVQVLGADHPDTLRTRSNLALTLGRSDRRGEAIGQFEALVLDRVRVLGPHHPDTLSTRQDLQALLELRDK